MYSKTVRTSECEIVCSSAKCSSCCKYRSNLRAMYHRWSKHWSCFTYSRESSVESSSTCSSSKFKNDRYLNTPEKISKIESLRKRAYSAEQNCREINKKK